jgi:hypothetical protein
MSIQRKKRITTDIIRERQSLSRKGVEKVAAANRGKKRSEEVRAKMRQNRKGRKVSKETCIKGSIARKSKKLYSFINVSGYIENNITQYDMKIKYKIEALSGLVTGKYKKSKGWKLYDGTTKA